MLFLFEFYIFSESYDFLFFYARLVPTSHDPLSFFIYAMIGGTMAQSALFLSAGSVEVSDDLE